MNPKRIERWLPLLLFAVLLVVALWADAQAQSDPFKFLEKTKETAKSGWSYLTTAAAFVVGGGALAAGGRALYRGEWQHGAIGIGFGIGILLLMWALGGFFFPN
jgi:hypothetical protein